MNVNRKPNSISKDYSGTWGNRFMKKKHEAENLLLTLLFSSFLHSKVHFASAFGVTRNFLQRSLNTLPFNRNEIKSVYEKQGYFFFLTFKIGMQLS